MALPNVTLFETQDGSHSLLSEAYGVPYHSKYGALQESRHVFIEAGLHTMLLGRAGLRILEVGFGTGLNALLSLQVGRTHSVDIFYQAIEREPISAELAAQLNYAACSGFPNDQELFLRMHRNGWGVTQEVVPGFQLHKIKGDFQTVALGGHFDLVYYDAFAPNAQSELWEEDILAKAVGVLPPGGVLVTYCAKGIVKRRLRDLGCTIEALPGPPGKREMTRATRRE